MMMPQDSENKTAQPDPCPDVVDAFYAGALEALKSAWAAIHIQRFDADAPSFSGPDDFYHGVVRSRLAINKLREEYESQRDQELSGA